MRLCKNFSVLALVLILGISQVYSATEYKTANPFVRITTNMLGYNFIAKKIFFLMHKRKLYRAASLLLKQMCTPLKPKKATEQQIFDLLAFYYANKTDDTDWVVLPEINFDAYFGNTTFSKKWIDKLPPEIFDRQANYGLCRFRVKS